MNLKEPKTQNMTYAYLESKEIRVVPVMCVPNKNDGARSARQTDDLTINETKQNTNSFPW